MKLLIVTQAVDAEDSILGFFVRWIEEFSKHAESIEVICLKEGKHALPENVRVHSLGKGTGVSRLTYVWRFYRHIWDLRHKYDSVLVHMNPEYIVLGGLWWKLWHKPVALWYTHKSVNMRLRIAAFWSTVIFTASKESFRLSSKKVRVMGHGIDTEFFSPSQEMNRSDAVLSAGRLSQTKRHDLVIRAAVHFQNEVWIVGEGPERQSLEDLARAESLSSRVHFFGPQTQEQLREKYRTAGRLAHTSETGSLDKVVLEALACGLPVVTTSSTLADLPVTIVSATPEALAEGLRAALPDTDGGVAYVQKHHSLQKLIPSMLEVLRAQPVIQ